MNVPVIYEKTVDCVMKACSSVDYRETLIMKERKDEDLNI
jgi:hypothetical protein